MDTIRQRRLPFPTNCSPWLPIANRRLEHVGVVTVQQV
jgi:hypothetical protein